MPRLTITNNSLPIGAYKCEFVGVEVTTHEAYGDGLKWTFLVTEGQHQGRECYRTTKCEPTPKNSCGRFLAALAGTKPADGMDVDTDEFVGRIYNTGRKGCPRFSWSQIRSEHHSAGGGS